jgi:hypothetical protein
MLRFVLYLVRWQLSTPILAPVMSIMQHKSAMFGTPEDWMAAGVANLIGGCIFFWVDRFIFKSRALERWEVLKAGACHDCGHVTLVRRLVVAPGGYDRTDDADPQYRCPDCSEKKLAQLIKEGRVKPN